MNFIKKLIAFVIRLVITYNIIPKQSNLFIFGGHRGNFLDNSAFLFKYCSEKEGEIEAIWLTEDKETIRFLRARGFKANNPHCSLKGLWTLLRAKAAFITHNIYDISFLLQYDRRIVIFFLTHGIGIKREGWLPKKKYKRITKHRKRTVVTTLTSNFLASLLSPYIPDLKLPKTAYIEDKKIVTGYPRNDVLFDKKSNLLDGQKRSLCTHKLYTVLYAPTWREWSPVRFFPFDGFKNKELIDFCRKNKVQFLLQFHAADTELYPSNISRYIKEFENNRWIKISSSTRNPYTLQDADSLITDYSTIYHDFLLLNRPIIFVPYDYEEFTNRVGMICNYKELTPGPKISTKEELFATIRSLLDGEDPYYKKRKEIRNILHKYQKGGYAKKVMESSKIILSLP